MTTQLPAGFTLDQAGSSPSLPPGFVSDQAPAPSGQPSDLLGLYQGTNKVMNNAIMALKFGLNKIPLPGMNEGLGSAIDNFGQAIGFPSAEQQVQGSNDYVTQQAANGRTPSTRGRIAGEIAATLPTLALPGGALAQGAVAGGLTTNASDPRGVATDMALGAAGGKAGEYAGGLIGSGLKTALSKVPKLASTDALKSAASNAYQQADNSGMIISGNAMRDLTQNIQDDLTSKGVDATLHPRAIAAFNRIAGAATDPATNGNVTLQGLDTLRKVAGQAATGMDKADGYMGHSIQDSIDDFVQNLGPQHVVGNVDQGALDALSNARQLWKTASKSDILDTALNKADNSASNLTQGGSENAQRTAFRQIANNKKIFGKFNSDEQDAILQVVRGGPVSNALRQLGKLAPRGVVSAGMDAALGAGTGLGFAPVMLAGEAGRMGSAMATNRAAQTASALVRNGGKALPPIPPNIQRLIALSRLPLRAAIPPIAAGLPQQWQQ